MPYYDDGRSVIYHGDALEVLDALPIGSFDAVVTDPPYCSGGRTQATARGILEKSDRDEWFLTDNMGTDTYPEFERMLSELEAEVREAGLPYDEWGVKRQVVNEDPDVLTLFDEDPDWMPLCIGCAARSEAS